MYGPKPPNTERQRSQRNTEIASVRIALAFLCVFDGLCVLCVKIFGFEWT